jgi:hypothetical protein
MKKCSVCNSEKPISQFAARNQKLEQYRTYCKECDKKKRSKYKCEYYKNNKEKHRTAVQRLRDRNKEYARNIKQNSCCAECGENRWQCLDFDHIDPSTKSFNISRIIHEGHSIEKLQIEIDKCQILCANCHRFRTSIQFDW